MAENIRCLNAAFGQSWALYHGDCVDVARQMPRAHSAQSTQQGL